MKSKATKFAAQARVHHTSSARRFDRDSTAKKAATIIHITAPGPPAATAKATPAIFPRPTEPESAAATAACWYLEYIRARMNLALTPDERGRQVITPGERPTRIVLTAVGLGLPFLAEPALLGHVVVVGGSALFLLAHAVRRLSRLDRRPPPAA